MAPELHEEISYDDAAVDLFSTGILLFLLRTGTVPFIKAVKSDNMYNLF